MSGAGWERDRRQGYHRDDREHRGRHGWHDYRRDDRDHRERDRDREYRRDDRDHRGHRERDRDREYGRDDHGRRDGHDGRERHHNQRDAESSGGRGDCLCHQQRFGIYANDAPHVLRQRDGCPPLLGTSREFCAAFFHLEDTPEAGLAELCLREGGQGKCARKDVVCVARLQHNPADKAATAGDKTPAWRDIYVARYHNCFRGGTERNLHAENFLTRDEKLLAALQDLGDLTDDGAILGTARLILYLTYQPCHNSGGHYGAGGHAISCTRVILDWVSRVLVPAGVPLFIRVAYTYRAHWNVGAGGAPEKYRQPVMAAREGLRLLAEHSGVELSAFGAADWRFLVGLCDGDARAMLLGAVGEGAASTGSSSGRHQGGGGAVGSDGREDGDVRAAARRQMDAFVARTLNDVCSPCATE
jgi:hypothetical protein